MVSSGEDFFAVSELFNEIFGDTVTDFTPVVNPSKKIISVKRNGETSYYQIHNDELFKAVTELSPKQADGILRIVGKGMRVTNNLITQFNPVFAVTNPIRDIRTAYKLSDVNNPGKFTLMYADSVYEIITNSEDYKRFKAMGGGHSSELTANTENIAKTLRMLAKKDKGIALRTLSAMRHPINIISSINDFTESIPRYMEFKRVLQETGDVQKAIFAANDLTTNFKRRGASSAAKTANTVFRFNNAAIQGVDKTVRTFADAKSSKRMKLIGKWLLDAVLMTFMQYFINKTICYMATIEDVRKSYGCETVESCMEAKEKVKKNMANYKKNVLIKKYSSKATAVKE